MGQQDPSIFPGELLSPAHVALALWLPPAGLSSNGFGPDLHPLFSDAV